MLFVGILSISGAPGFMLQGMAWWHMAVEAGGVEKISEAMFDVAPCPLCRAARDLDQDSPGGKPNAPAPTEGNNGFRLTATVTSQNVMRSASPEFILRTGLPHPSGLFPETRRDRPATPPPQLLA